MKKSKAGPKKSKCKNFENLKPGAVQEMKA
jgi:hypothetical protein